MYKEKLMVDSGVLPEHLSIAQEFSNEMMERFNEEQINEILHHIRRMFKESREKEIAETQKKLEYLQITLESL